MPAFVLGGIALAGGIFSAFGNSSTAAAQAAQAEIQQRQANFQAQWQHEAAARNQMRQFQANLELNMQIEKGANNERALSEMFLDQDFLNKKGTLSKESNIVNAQFLSTMSGRSISANSGTARALLRQNMSAVGANMIALKTNYRNQYKDIENQQNNRLSTRQFSFQEQAVFLPQTGGIMNSSSSALMNGLISAGIGAVGAGVGGYYRYGVGSWAGGTAQSNYDRLPPGVVIGARGPQ